MSTIAATPARMATYADYRKQEPDHVGPHAHTWVTRSANFVIATSEVRPSAVFERQGRDETFVLIARGSVRIESNGASVLAAAETLTIVPPGAQRIEALAPGRIAIIATSRETDLLALAGNAARYRTHPPEVAPLVDWPPPPAGFRLRHYVLADHARADSNMRLFRSSTLMVNALKKRPVPRSVHHLEPHAHSDFEQASLILEGRYIHHLRYPWTADMATWCPDEHIEIGHPSVTIIPAGVVHTSRNIGNEPGWLIDVFAPPRIDFSLEPGLVCNAHEYPLPPTFSKRP